jgi:hypothetical protein
MSKYDRVRDAYHRAHDDFDFQLCTFYTYTTSYDASTGETSITQDQTHSANCEVLQPSQSNLDQERYGVETNVDIVLRLRKDETFISSLDLMGDDVEYQSQVETASGKRFKLIDTIFEQDSAFITTPATESSAPDE